VTDTISIRGLRVQTRIGVSDDERAATRGLTVNVDLGTDTRRAGASDDLSDTVDYGKAAEEIAELVESSETKLLEHLAERIADHFSAMNGVKSIIVEVVKDDPPIDADVREVAVRIERP
jgi:dihydroneopterin aldolase